MSKVWEGAKEVLDVGTKFIVVMTCGLVTRAIIKGKMI